MKKTIAMLLISSILLVPSMIPALSFADTTSASSFAHLGLGSRGANVTALQTLLSKDPTIYPEGMVTGYFGPLTVKAIKRLQLKNGLLQTGAVGPLTLLRLQALLAASQTPAPVPTAPVVTPTTTPTMTPVTTPATTTPAAAATTSPAVATTTTPTTPVSSDTTPPDISYISSNSPTYQSSTIINVLWSTNEPATSKVYYSTATPLVTATASSTSVAGLTYQHSVTITGLQYNTGYNYIIESADAAGNVSQTQPQSFHTTN